MLEKGGKQFLSTPSARRATLGVLVDDRVQHISIHALREEGDLTDEMKKAESLFISIHALREEGDKYFAPT